MKGNNLQLDLSVKKQSGSLYRKELDKGASYRHISSIFILIR